MQRWRAFLKNSSFKDIVLIVKIGLWLLLMPFLIRTMSLKKLLHMLTPKNSENRTGYSKEKIIEYTFLWLSQNNPLFSRNCLKRCLVLYHFLRKEGFNVSFVLGVRREQGKLRGHSWLLLEGAPLFEEEDTNYSVIYSYPP